MMVDEKLAWRTEDGEVAYYRASYVRKLARHRERELLLAAASVYALVKTDGTPEEKLQVRQVVEANLFYAGYVPWDNDEDGAIHSAQDLVRKWIQRNWEEVTETARAIELSEDRPASFAEIAGDAPRSVRRVFDEDE